MPSLHVSEGGAPLAWLRRALHESTGTLVAAALALVTFAVFSAALENDFVDWDDVVLITRNQEYRGLGWPQIRWMFSTILMGHYVPLTWLSLGLDYVIWGMAPAGYHLTNVVLHAANVAIGFFIAWRLLRSATPFSRPILIIGASAAALFFGLHPLRAESVAWVTERRDVLSGFFFLLTLLLYLQARDLRGRARVLRHAAACACYLLAILSKSMVMTLPAILVLLDVYPFRRLDRRPATWWSATAWREKVPYLALGILAAMLGYWAQAANNYITSAGQIPWSARPALVAHSLWFYVWKTALPFDLSPLYERPATIDVWAPLFVVPALAVGLVVATLAALARRWPAGLAVGAAYALMLAPISGVVHSGHQLTHDRYSYLACLGWALLVGAGLAWACDASRRGRIQPVIAGTLMAVVTAWIAALGFLTWHQVQTWRDNEALWTHAVESTPGCSVCELNLGAARLNQNRLTSALDSLERALAERPDRTKAYNNLGLAFARQGAVEKAIPHFQRAVDVHPNDASALMNLGVALMKVGRSTEGVVYLRRAAQAAPDDSLIVANLGFALVDTRRPSEAIELLRRAIDKDGTSGYPRHALVAALVAAGDLRAARRELAFLRVIDPNAAIVAGPAVLETW